MVAPVGEDICGTSIDEREKRTKARGHYLPSLPGETNYKARSSDRACKLLSKMRSQRANAEAKKT